MSKGNMNKAKQSIFTPQNDAPQHTVHKANDIRFQKSSLASMDKNENNFFLERACIFLLEVLTCCS